MPNIEGWIHDEVEVEKVLATLENPYFSKAADVLTTSGKGKSAFLYKNFKNLGIVFPQPIQNSVGDCVSHATSTAVDTLLVTEIAIGERESWVARTASEYIYNISRVVIGGNRFRSDGSINAWAAKGISDYGTLIRIKYNSVDLIKYSDTRAREWGSTKLPQELMEEAKKHNIQTFSAVKNFSEACDSLYNGYPIIVASSQGFSDNRDNDGFCRPSGTWQHSMAVTGYKDDNRPGVVINNSWPGFLPGENKWGLPPSSFFCDAEIFNRMCQFNDTFSFSGFNGYKLRPNARVI